MTETPKDKSAEDAPVEVPEWRRRLYTSTSLAGPLPLQLLRMTHTGRVFEDGMTRGMGSLIGSIVGLPRDLYEFGRERWTGEKRAAPKDERVMSSDWIEKKLDRQIDENNKYWTGRKGPEIREGTGDKYVHMGGKVAPLVGSFFIPGAGQAQLATLGSKLGAIGKAVPVLGKLGTQLGLVELGTLGVEGVEYVAGVERPTEAVAPQGNSSASGKVTPAPVAAQAHDLTAMASKIAEKTQARSYDSSDRGVIQKVFNARYLADPAVAGAFDPVKVKFLQMDLVSSGYLKPTPHNPKPVDGIFGSETVKALDASVRTSLKPSDVSAEQRQIFEKQLRLLAIDLKDNPPSVENFDSRVLSFQANAYALGLYDGKLDGLKGSKTDAVLARSGPQAEAPKQVLKGPEMSPM